MRLPVLAVGLLFIGSSAFAADVDADLKHERLQIGHAISDAQAEQQKYPGGMLGSLIAARLELLKTNDAILQQRILAGAGGAKVEIVVPASTPDPQRADALATEMHKLEERIAAQEIESGKYTGGFVKAMVESGIATTRLSLEMIRIEYLKAKYGIVWAPALNGQSSPQAKAPAVTTAGSDAVGSTGSIDQHARLLVPTVSNKRYVPHDYQAGNVQDLLVFDIAWDTSKLKRPTRAIKGILVFEDLFGEPQFRIRLTIDDALKPGQKFTQKEIGFKYNEFMAEHQWVRSTDLKNMKVEFEPNEILYADGQREKL